MGERPTSYDEIVMMGSLQKEGSGIINFINPFKTTISVLINLVCNEHSIDVIEIIQKKPKSNVPGLGTHQIPFTFYPREIRDYTASVVVELNDKISWTFPIKVITESRSVDVDFSFQTQCRKRLEKDIELNLAGLTDVSPNEKFYAEVNPLNQEHAANVKKWLVLVPLKNFMNSVEDSLTYSMKFMPFKPFKTAAEIIVTRASGGRWRFRVIAEA